MKTRHIPAWTIEKGTKLLLKNRVLTVKEIYKHSPKSIIQVWFDDKEIQYRQFNNLAPVYEVV